MNIPLSKERGIDPHLTCCVECGQDTNGLTLGVIMEGKDTDGNLHYTQRGSTHKYTKDLYRNSPFALSIDWNELTDTNKRIPMGLCTECEELHAMALQALEDGAIYFNCDCCDITGMLKGESELAIAVRKQQNIPAPEPVGVTFDSCDQHIPSQ